MHLAPPQGLASTNGPKRQIAHTIFKSVTNLFTWAPVLFVFK